MRLVIQKFRSLPVTRKAIASSKPVSVAGNLTETKRRHIAQSVRKVTKMPVKTVFQTDDGEVFVTSEEANEHQVVLDLKAAYKRYMNGRPGGLGLDGFMEFLNINRDEILAYYRRQRT
jgi:hypothetical protein